MRKPVKANDPPFTEGDDVWVQCKVTRLEAGDDGSVERVTVRMPNGNLETFPYGEEWVRSDD